jgi:hypothetical protein
MNASSYRAFVADVRRYRPALTIVLATIVVIPDGMAFIHQELSVIQVLEHFAQSLVGIGVLVWAVTAVLVHYANTQAKVPQGSERDEEMSS